MSALLFLLLILILSILSFCFPVIINWISSLKITLEREKKSNLVSVSMTKEQHKEWKEYLKAKKELMK